MSRHSLTSTPALTTTLAGISLRNPVLLAAGTAGYVDEMAGAMDLSRVGGVVTKSITAESREGNQTWRIIETPRGMLNAIGLANIGAERFAAEHAPRAGEALATVIGSIAGDSPESYLEVARMFENAEHIPAVELNVSCPNVHSGTHFGDDPGALRELVQAVRPALATTKLFVKLSPIPGGPPGFTIVDLARAAIEAGADGLCIANTVPAMAVDVQTRKPRLANVTGGLSGPSVHPIAVRLVHLVHQGVARETGTPIVGVGGVMSWQDAAEFILVGASAVQMGAALFADPRSPLAVVKGLEAWVKRQGASNIGELVGAVELPGGRA